MMDTEIAKEELQKSYIFSMDIGTRSIIGMVGCVEDYKFTVLAIEKEEHHVRSMVDGQIEDISQVAKVAKSIKEKLEKETGIVLSKAYVAAAGRALKTRKVSYTLELEAPATLTEDVVRNLETGALMKAEEEFLPEKEEEQNRQFYMVGYTVSQYYLDGYPISSLLNHKGKEMKADMVTTFLPSEVVESLYSTLHEAGIEVAGMTLEPIASMNAAIPKELRLLNLVLVDIGAGTSDIAVARDGGICGYTMATVAGDEITENLMKEYLIDFQTAENLKMQVETDIELTYTDVLGLEQKVKTQELRAKIEPVIKDLCEQISLQILEVNGVAPSAVFLAGGGSKMFGVREGVAKALDMDLSRIALGGNNFSRHAVSLKYDLNDPEYSTPLGIGISAGLNLISDSFYVNLNGQRAKLFRSGKLTIRDVLMMNGYGYKHLISRSGKSFKIEIDGKKHIVRGEYAIPAQIQLNGHVASVSDIVNAGDNITFIQAVNGRDAEAAIKDVPEFYDKGSILLDGEDIPIGILAQINEVIVPIDTILQQGDSINTIRLLTVEDLVAYQKIEHPLLVNGLSPSYDQVLHGADIVNIVTDEMQKPKDTSDLSSQKSSDISSTGDVTFCLNGQDITPVPKQGGDPFYLMDLLSYTGMDFSKPQGIVALKVNGDEAGFQTELKAGDRIEIGWSSDQ